MGRNFDSIFVWGPKKISVAAAVVILIALAIITRYEIVGVADTGSAVVYRLDRWTGAVQWCVPARCDPLR